MAQINYVSRNQNYCTANLNFGLMCKKTKHCWALSTNIFYFCSADIFSWSYFASCRIGAKIQITQNSHMMKWFYETELRGIYLYPKNVSTKNHAKHCCMDFIMIILLIAWKYRRKFNPLWLHRHCRTFFLPGKKYVENVYVYFLTAQGQSNISFPRVTG